MLKLSREAGAKRVFLEVRVGNMVAISMYRKVGFLQVKQVEHYYRSDSVAACVLALNDLDRANIWQPLQKSLDRIVIDLT